MKPLIGFIGQGWIGKNYADNFESRDYEVVRYALEASYQVNKAKINDCDLVFIAVPTPTSSAGFDGSIVESTLELIGPGKIAVIKSTIIPGFTKALQLKYSDRVVLFSPEFLSEATAASDSANPFSNIIGLPVDDEAHQTAAKLVQQVLPPASFNLICDSTEAELVKYSHNINGYVQIVLFNLIYDLASQLGVDWAVIQSALKADPYLPQAYLNPVHKGGRGAGGGCFIKDFEAFRQLYEKQGNDQLGLAILEALKNKNLALLKQTNKNQDLVDQVYGA